MTGAKFLMSLLNRIFLHPSSKFLADLSYSVYLVHWVMMLPLFAYVLQGGQLSLPEWAGYTTLLLMPVIALAYMTYRFIELPGIQLGKSIIGRDKKFSHDRIGN